MGTFTEHDMEAMNMPKTLARALVAISFAMLTAVPPLGAEIAAAEAGQTFEANGATIYYEVRGDGAGTPLILVNGGPGFDHTYLHVSDIWDRMAEDRKVVFYDQRGNGRSGALSVGQSCTLADQIADLDALRVHLGFERIDLLGHSWGGYLAMAYAARYPEHVAHLVICDSAAPKWSDTLFLFSEVFPDTVARQEAVAFAEALGDPEATATSVREYLSMLFYSTEHRDAFLEHASEFSYSMEINGMLNQDLARFDLNPELGKFDFPTLVITGRWDMNVAPLVAWKIHHAIPGSELAIFEKSGHLPWYEEPERFRRVVEAFLSR